MKIEKGNFIWRSKLTPLDLQRVNAIALHHMAHPMWTEQDVHKYHYETKRWNGIGYNYFIRLDGRIIDCRGLNVGAGVEGQNSRLINIGFQGDYDNQEEMPKEQFDSGVWLINYLKATIPSIKLVEGHHRWNPTACPGRYFPLALMINAKPTEEIIDWQTAIVKEAHKKGLILDRDKWTLNKENSMPTWAVLAVAINNYDKMTAEIEKLKSEIKNMKGGK